MLKRTKRLSRWGVTLGVIALAGTGLFQAGPALAQGQMRAMNTDTNNLVEDAFAYVTHNSYFQVGGAYLDYYGDSTNIKIHNAQGLAAQVFGPGESILYGTGTTLADKWFPAGTLGIYIPWTGHHLAQEVTISTPITFHLHFTGRAVDQSLAPYALKGNGSGNRIPTGVPPLGRDIGTAKAFPPNMTFVFRPWTDTMLRPYIGAGAMWLWTYDTDVQNPVLSEVNQPNLHLDNPFACILQAGLDLYAWKGLYVNFDAKWIGCATIKASMTNVKVRAPDLPQFGVIDVGTVSTENTFRAWLYQFSIGYEF